MNWTTDQERAIYERGGNLLLAAAAGSGKTTVLVERVLTLIEEGASVDEMLIVTFSRAAAADMKKKLTDKLTLRAEQNPAMRVQLERVERARVSTLHSFCIEVLRTHFEAAGVDPSFRLLEENEARNLKARAVQAALEQAFEQMPAQMEALDFGRGVKRLSDMVEEIYAFAENRPDTHGWLRQALIDWPEMGNPKWEEMLLGEARALLGEALEVARYAREICRLPRGPLPYEAALAADEAAIEALLDARDYEQLRAGLCQYKPGGIGRITQKDDVDEALKKQVASARTDLIKKPVDKAREMLIDRADAARDMGASAPIMRTLHALILLFEETYRALKADRSALSFNDLEHAALTALKVPHVAQTLRDRFAYVFIDEYQDVSDLQEALIARVARADNLFMVGDVKQSIYRFREAEPALFIGKYHAYGRGDGGRVIALSQNFRSRASILSFTNRVFERVMAGDRSETPYDEAAHLVLGARYEGDDPAIEIHLIDRKSAPEADEGNAKQSSGESESAFVARRIRELLQSTLPGHAAPLRPRDIAVISRNNQSLLTCARLLHTAGIPAYADVDAGYFSVYEVKLMLSLMEVVDNRRRDYPLLAVLRSPIVSLTSSDLARIRAALPKGSFRGAMERYMERDDELASRLRDFDRQLDRFRMLSRALPLHELTDLMLRETGFYHYAGSMPLGAERQGNLDLLSAYARDFDSAEGGGLNAFLHYVQEVQRAGDSAGTAHTLGAGDDVVHLMTVHRSKGLEFPVVFGLQMGKSLKGRESASELRLHRDLGVGLRYHDMELGTRRETVARTAISILKAREALEEEKRVLYVMLTRAKEQLILLGAIANPDAQMQRFHMMRALDIRPGSFLDMVMPAVLDKPEPEPPRICVVHHDSERITPYEAPDAEQAPIEEHEIAQAREALAWQYPYMDEAFLPVKLTVSGLAHTIEGARAQPTVSRRPRFLTGERMTAAERGTLTHAAMSAIDLGRLRGLEGAALEGAVHAEIERLHGRGILHERVSPRPIAAFFSRALGRRLLAADEVRREWPFNLRMAVREALSIDSEGELMVQGVVDCCFLEDDQWVLLDYKTDRLPDEAELADRYRAQLTLYRHALERITGKAVKETHLCLLAMGSEMRL